MSVVILIPVLGRPHRVKPTLDSIRDATAQPYRVLFICNPDDQGEIRAIEAEGGEYLIHDGNYASKINAGFEATDEEFLFMAADDLKFWPDWFKRAHCCMVPGTDVVGTNDIANPRVMTGQHSTHTLFRRSYIEEHGTIDEEGKVLHEGYVHEYCDDEFIETAMARGVYAHAFDAIVEHLHPMVDKAPDDATYRLGRRHTRVSRKLFHQRRRLWRTSRSFQRSTESSTARARRQRRTWTSTGSSSLIST